MNKMYSKPDIMFEDFSLSTSIANCDVKTHTPSQGNCAVQFGAMKVFTSQVTGCKANGSTIVESGVFNGFCYHVPTNNRSMFNS